MNILHTHTFFKSILTGILLFGVFMPLSYAGGIVSILGESDESAEWQDFLLKNGTDSKITEWESFAIDTPKPDILIIHNTSFDFKGNVNTFSKKVIPVLEKFVADGGRLLVTENAGVINGNYTLTELLKTGKKTITIPMLYPEFLGYDETKVDALAVKCMDSGADGLGFFTDVTLRMHKWRPKKPDLTPMAARIFSSPLVNQSKGPLYSGMPETCKLLYCSGSWLTGKYKTSPAELAEYAHSVNANVICLAIWGSGWEEHPLYISDLPSCAHWEKDAPDKNYLSTLIEECRKYNIQIWPSIPAMPAVISRPYCQEFQIKDSGANAGKFCPYAAKEYYGRILKLLEELLVKYPYFNVVSIDEPTLGGVKKGEWRCFCKNCKTLFHRKYGKELRTEDVISGNKGENISREFREFREEIMLDYYFKPLKKAIDRVNPMIKILVWNPIGQELGAINPSYLAYNGIDIIIGTEFPYALNGPCKNIFKHKAQYFNFKNLFIGGKEIPTVGQGLEMDTFNGAKIIASMKNGDFKYPAIISANNGKTLYFCFNPLLYNDSNTILLIKTFLESPTSNPLKTGAGK